MDTLRETAYNLIINILFLVKKIIKLKTCFKSYSTLELLIIYNIIIIIILTNYAGVMKYAEA